MVARQKSLACVCDDKTPQHVYRPPTPYICANLRVVWIESGLPCTQAWLQRHGPFDAVLDGANIALFGQNVDRGAFSFAQIEAALGRLRADSSGMRPLLVRACSVG